MMLVRRYLNKPGLAVRVRLRGQKSAVPAAPPGTEEAAAVAVMDEPRQAQADAGPVSEEASQPALASIMAVFSVPQPAHVRSDSAHGQESDQRGSG